MIYDHPPTLAIAAKLGKDPVLCLTKHGSSYFARVDWPYPNKHGYSSLSYSDSTIRAALMGMRDGLSALVDKEEHPGTVRRRIERWKQSRGVATEITVEITVGSESEPPPTG
jgi:hypothetical protein